MNIEEVGDRYAIRKLVDEYALAVDTRDGDRFAALFAADGKLAVFEPEEDSPSLVYSGHDELRTVVELVSAFSVTYHVMTNHVVELNGDTATGSTYGLTHHLGDDPDGGGLRDTLMLLRYDDDLRREDGGWVFAERRIIRQWTDYLPAEKARLAG